MLTNDECTYSLESVIHRGECIVRDATSKYGEVIIKVHGEQDQFPTAQARHRILNEYSIGKSLYEEATEKGKKSLLKFHSLVRHGRGPAILMEKFNGKSMESLLENNKILSIELVLELSLKIANCLSILHENKITHNNLCLNHILWDVNSNDIRIIDFKDCVRQTKFELNNPVVLPRSTSRMYYMSPEQTGRTEKMVDHRTDLYTLGVILYRLCTGFMPFESAEHDPLEILHYVVAKEIQSPYERSQVPLCVSDVIMHLLEKDANQRYQTTLGVRHDLKMCQQHYKNSNSKIPIGERDLASVTFRASDKLYGRSAQVKTITDIFTSTSKGQLVMLSGYSGVGKSTFMDHIKTCLTKLGGVCISGGIDEIKRDSPYTCIIEALSQMVSLILTKSNQQVLYWRSEILNALGANAQIIIDVIPQVELIIGSQPTVPNVNSSENTNRFKSVLSSFLYVFAKHDHPIVICLDNMHYCNVSVVNLIETICSSDKFKNIMLICAYRGQSVGVDHPLTFLLDRFKSTLISIDLGPLSLEDYHRFISDSLKRKDEELSTIVYNRTHGDIFSAISFLSNLYSDNILYYDHQSDGWKWDKQNVLVADCPENVVDMITHRIKKLPQVTQKELSIAACIGFQFDCVLLSTLCNQPVMLWSAINQGLVLVEKVDQESGQPISMRFVHHKVHTAAYQLITNHEDLIQVHLKIGRLLLSGTDQEIDDRLFDIFEHYNKARPFTTVPPEGEQLFNLLLKASKKAKNSSSYAMSANFASFAIELLALMKGQDLMWHENYESTLECYSIWTESESLLCNYKQSDLLYPIISSHCVNNIDKMNITALRLGQLEQEQRFEETISLALSSLSVVGITLPSPSDKLAISSELDEQIKKVDENMRGRSISNLMDQPEVVDQDMLSTMNVLICLWGTCFATGARDLLNLVSYKMLNLTLTHDHCEVSSAGYVFYSFISILINGDYRSAYEYGKVGIALSNRYNNISLRCKCLHLFAAGPMVWCEPVSSSVKELEKCYEMCLQIGNITYACYCMAYLFVDGCIYGEDLSITLKRQKKLSNFVRIHNPYIYSVVLTSSHHIDWLTNCKDDAQFGPTPAEPLKHAVYLYARIQLSYLSEDHDRWLTDADEAYDFVPLVLQGTFKVVETYFYVAMIYLGHVGYVNQLEQSNRMNKVDQIINKMINWNQFCNFNVSARLQLIQAEYQRVQCNYYKAIELFEMAIDTCKMVNAQHIEAMANELIGKLRLQMSNRQWYATPHLEEAVQLYNQWGAIGKVIQMQNKYNQLVRPLEQLNNPHPCYSPMSFTVPFEDMSPSSSVSPIDRNSVSDLMIAMKGLPKQSLAKPLLKNTLMR
ncbi:hypothetical protein AKO1_012526 [Acrasis kona]|uniref:Protein kinase domain-containing protein n=1 Tax=Acrasis kona TaxID=1008807 RepID=A0AAW2YW28_9EUKA